MRNSFAFVLGLKNGLLGYNLKEKKATIFHGGDKPILAITTHKLGEAIARILINPTPYLNTTLHLTSITFTQNSILHLLESKTNVKWVREDTTTVETIEFGKKLLATGGSEAVFGIYAIVGAVMYDQEEYMGVYTRKEADELGLEQDDLERVIDAVLDEVREESR